MSDNTHNEGDRVYFDDNAGTVINGGPAYYEVEWDNGHTSWVSEFDLMSQDEHNEDMAERDHQAEAAYLEGDSR